MLEKPMDILQAFPVRKSRKQKQDFRDEVERYAQSLGYETQVEKGSLNSKNLIMGDPEKADYLITAHYDTCARMPFPNLLTPCNLGWFLGYQVLIALVMILPMVAVSAAVGYLTKDPTLGMLAGDAVLLLILWLLMAGPANPSNVNDNSSGVITLLEIAKTLPQNQRHKVCFVLFDLEELGMIGSASYQSKHKKQTSHQLVINLDCVSDGDYLMMFPTKKLKKDKKKLSSLYKACGYFGKKSLVVREKGFSIYPSDQVSFPYGVGVCALNKGKCGLYLGRIHTAKDTIMDETNINILRAALITLISTDRI